MFRMAMIMCLFVENMNIEVYTMNYVIQSNEDE